MFKNIWNLKLNSSQVQNKNMDALKPLIHKSFLVITPRQSDTPDQLLCSPASMRSITTRLATCARIVNCSCH